MVTIPAVEVAVFVNLPRRDSKTQAGSMMFSGQVDQDSQEILNKPSESCV